MNQNPTLELDDVTLTLGDGDETVLALDRVSLTVRPGELAAIVGPSGSGKSSLLAVAGALTPATSGQVRVDGIDLSAAKPRQRSRIRRDRIGFVFQSGNLLPSLNAIDQLRLLTMFGRKSGFRDPAELLDAVGMSHKSDRRPHQLSGGERQRVGIARALMTGAPLLLIDEPTAALDRQRSQDIVELLAREVYDRGVAAVMVTHDHDVLHHCHDVHEMIDGSLKVYAPRP